MSKTLETQMREAKNNVMYFRETLNEAVNEQSDELEMFEALNNYANAAAELKTLKAIYLTREITKFLDKASKMK